MPTARAVTSRLADLTADVTLAAPADGQLLAYVAATGRWTNLPLSGDVTVGGGGVTTVNAATFVKAANVVKRETPAGAVDGANAAFTLAAAPLAGSEEVYLNGILQDPGAGNDYTLAGAALTMSTAPAATDKIRVSYLK